MMNRRILLLLCILIFFLLSFSVVNAKDNSTNTKTKVKDTNMLNQEKVVKNTQIKKENVKTIKAVNNKESTSNHPKTNDSYNKLNKKNISLNKVKNDYGDEDEYDYEEDYYEPIYEIWGSSDRIGPKTFMLTASVTNYSGSKVNSGNVYYYIDNNYVGSCHVKGGNASLNYKFNSYGYYSYYVEYEDNYGFSTDDMDIGNYIEFEKTKRNMNVRAPYSVEINNKVEIATSIINDNDYKSSAKISVYINNKLFSTKKAAKTLKFNLGKLKEGTHNIKVKYKNNFNEQMEVTRKVIVTRKKETLNMNLPSYSTNDKKVSVTVKVTNDTEKLKVGKVNLKIKNKKLASSKVSNGKAVMTVTMPRNSGKYKIVAEYVKGKVLAKTEDIIIIKDTEKMEFNLPKKLPPKSKYTFNVKITSPNTKVNYGKVKVTLKGKTLANENVKNNKMSFKCRLPKTPRKYTFTAYYIKNNNVILKESRTINVKYSYTTYVYSDYSAENGEYISVYADVYNKNNAKASTGKVNFYMDNKKIGSSKIEYGYAYLYYKVNAKKGNHKIKAEYVNTKNQIDSSRDYENIKIFNKLDTRKGVQLARFEFNKLDTTGETLYIGPDEIKCSYQNYVTMFEKGTNIEMYYNITEYDYIPHKYRLLKARVYYKNKNNKIIAKTATAKTVRQYTLLNTPLVKNYKPYKATIAYRKMNKIEKRLIYQDTLMI